MTKEEIKDSASRMIVHDEDGKLLYIVGIQFGRLAGAEKPISWAVRENSYTFDGWDDMEERLAVLMNVNGFVD